MQGLFLANNLRSIQQLDILLIDGKVPGFDPGWVIVGLRLCRKEILRARQERRWLQLFEANYRVYAKKPIAVIMSFEFQFIIIIRWIFAL